jgi:phosphohistidine swiveling domain-containing protein
VMRNLSSRPYCRIIFRWCLRHARARTRDRENLRFERTRLFGRVRRIFLQIGRRLAADRHLADARDVFYLDIDEILRFLSGTSTATDLRALTAMRRAEFAAFAQQAAPGARLTTRGSPYATQQETQPLATAPPSDVRQGISCCPGYARGTARVITDPKDAHIEAGEILVAEHTDPGWILLFSGARGLIIERGSVLSHSAIVARELAIPTIVGVPEVSRWLSDGDQIEMDGATGIVRKLSSSQTATFGCHEVVTSAARTHSPALNEEDVSCYGSSF